MQIDQKFSAFDLLMSHCLLEISVTEIRIEFWKRKKKNVVIYSYHRLFLLGFWSQHKKIQELYAHEADFNGEGFLSFIIHDRELISFSPD